MLLIKLDYYYYYLIYPNGVLIFSNNFRKFKMDELTERQFDCQNITPQTLDMDFERNPRIHNVWKITRRSSFG